MEYLTKQRSAGYQEKLYRAKRSFISSWQKGHQEARRDMRRNWLIFIIVLFWVVELIICLIVLLILNGIWTDQFSACQPDGTFSIVGTRDFSYWSSSGFFQISMGMGALTFSQAKAIDIVWDIIFGRGGQSLIAYISWRVFAQYFTVSMEHSPITFNTYRTIFLQKESTIIAIVRLSRDFAQRLRLRSRFAMVFAIATMLFILAFPTMGSAMTGYSANVESYVPDKDNNYVRFSKWRRTAYIIHDGGRVNKTEDFHVPHVQSVDPLQIDYDYEDWYYLGDHYLDHDQQQCDYLHDMVNHNSFSHNEDCHFLFNVSAYVQEYGFGGTNNQSSRFKGQVLSEPTLNITPLYIRQNDYLFGAGVADDSKAAWTWSGQVFDKNHVTKEGRCQQSHETYQWGFSYVQLMAMIILTLIWSIGILIMHLVARRNCRRGRQTVASGNKAIFEIAYAMQHQLSCVGCKQLENVNPPQEPPTSDTSSTDPRGVDVEVSYESMLSFSALTDKEIHKRISVDLRGGSMSYTAYKRESTRQNRTAIQALLVWCVKELWWLTGLFLTAAVSAGSIYGAFNCVTFALFPSYILGWGLLFAVPFAFFTGSTQASRITLLVYSYLLGAITPAVATGGIVLSHHS